MMSLKPLLTKQISSSKEKLLTQRNIITQFPEQSGLICLLWGKLLYDNRNPLRLYSEAVFLVFSFLLTFGFLGLFLVYSSCHIYSGDVCSRLNKLPP